MEAARGFKEYVGFVAAGGRAEMEGAAEMLRDVVERYPWFTTARILLAAETGCYDPLLRLYLHANALPISIFGNISGTRTPYAEAGEPVSGALGSAGGGNMWKSVSASTAGGDIGQTVAVPEAGSNAAQPAKRDNDPRALSQAAIIENFLSRGEYRIVPGSDTPQEDAAAESSLLDLSDDMISEDLAEIYLTQGLNKEARAIYYRLSLLNSEKSVYFAELIADIDRREHKKND